MAANVLKNYNQNPYETRRPTRPMVLFATEEFDLSMLLGQSPVALRVMICLASRLNSKGYAVASLDELAKMLGHSRSYVNRSILDLVDHGLIRKRKRGEYWLRPGTFRTAYIQV